MKNYTFLFIFSILLFSCQTSSEPQPLTPEEESKMHLEAKTQMEAVMKKHLDAVSNKDLTTLKSTMHPEGKMQLILPSTEIINGVKDFMEFHTAWFSSDSNWTFETKILNSEVGEKLGIVITELTYREPERNGKPYFNRQTVSYVLEKIDSAWYVIKDHCTSTEKSTDKE